MMADNSTYISAVVGYMITLVIAGTLLTFLIVPEWSPIDSLYYVVQTLWTVGYGDMIPPGDSGELLSVVLILFGVVGITSALGVVGSSIITNNSERKGKIQKAVDDAENDRREALYKWADEQNISRELVDKAIEEVKNEQRSS